MKKFMVLLLVGLLIVSCSAAFADYSAEGNFNSNGVGPTVSVPLQAEVLKFAKATWICSTIDDLVLSGAAPSWDQGDVDAKVESNCDVWVKISGDKFKKVVNGTTYSLTTKIRVNDNDNNHWLTLPGAEVAQDVGDPLPSNWGTNVFDIDYRAEISSITAQPAGTYGTQLIMTVYSKNPF